MHFKRAFVILRNVFFLIAILIIFVLIMLLFKDYSVQLPIKVISIIILAEVLLFFISVGFSQISILKYSGDIVNCGEKIKLGIYVNKRGIYAFKKLDVVLWYKNIYDDKYTRKKIHIELSDAIRQRHDIEIEAKNCGYISIGFEKAFIYDMFAFLNFRCSIKNGQSTVMVMPKISPVEIDSNSFNRISLDEEEVFRGDIERKGLMDKYEIREFIPGDSLNRIHWKLTAKNDEFMVKEFKDLASVKTYVYFDLRKGSNLDKMYEETISMSYTLVEKKIVFYAMWVEYDNILCRYVLKRKKIKDEAGILEALSEIMKVSLYEDAVEVNNILGQIINEDGSINSTFTL